MIGPLAAAAQRDVPRETSERLDRYAVLLAEESARQNLIARSTLESLWERHIVDSAQLVRFEPFAGAAWVDIGSGAGLPGIVIACLVEGPVTLVEPRRLRAAFLGRCVAELGLNATVSCAKAERISGRFDVLTARAVAPLAELLRISHHLSTEKSVWVLPRGRSAQSELAGVRRAWQGRFHVEPSATDEDSRIIIGTGVRER